MKDSKFSAEYKKSVNSVALPADYKSKILSALREQAQQLEHEESKPQSEVTELNTSLTQHTNHEENLNNETTPEINHETKETTHDTTQETTQVIPINSKGKNKTKTLKQFWRYIPGIAAAFLIIIGGLLFLNFSVSDLPTTQDLQFTVASATNLSNVSGAKITFRNNSGEVIKDEDGNPVVAYTDANGNAQISLPVAEGYSAEIHANGYIPYEVPVYSGHVYISPVMNEDTYRAVLTWENPCDLDAILTVTHGEKSEQLFYFNSNILDNSGELIAALDTDSSTPGSPETITFNATEDGVFRFSVASYSSLSNDDPTDLARSKAQVTLYKGDSIVDTYDVDADAQGNAWCVFEVKGSEINEVDSTYSINAMTEVY